MISGGAERVKVQCLETNVSDLMTTTMMIFGVVVPTSNLTERGKGEGDV